ncbi:Low specificity L-threonine aldolase (plasmid) [Pseudoseohaeicola sp. NH-UV-7]|uniref:threonine aldolase family protein n=1 Tax=unclassified Sulfitobacter TaxID=196795 RepID=UPI000E0B15E9|nr:beta-eliminating lyase-related protein [Sulfitobacter sp. JL08]AXI55936.1 low specificity L-threonine aldolase [Sulfitobacter sp. JL08]
MFFASDNAGRVHPQVMDALATANEGFAKPYGADPIMQDVRTRLREIFEAPEAAIYLVATGTAANSIALATIGQPWQTVFCSPVAHIQEDECNAPEFYSGGAKLTLVGDRDKMSAQALNAAIGREETRGVHGAQRGPVSITQVTERGSVYTLDEIRALCDVAKSFDVPVHLDGARFANAQVALGCSAADMTWKAGVDVVSFGGTKNGLMGVEAVILFDPSKAWEFELRRKRGAHLFSKHRYLSAQMAAYLRDDLWLDSARAANANCARLANGLANAGAQLLYEPQANMIFADFPRAAHQRLHDAGAIYYVWEGQLDGNDPEELLTARLVCDWSITHDQIDRFVDILKG